MSFQTLVLPMALADRAAGASAFLDRIAARAYSTPEARKPLGSLGVFYDQLIATYPEIDGTSNADQEDCPWSEAILGPWDDHVALNIVWSRVLDVPPFVIALAGRLGLSVLDPQAGILYRPAGAPGSHPGHIECPYLLVPRAPVGDGLIGDIMTLIGNKSAEPLPTNQFLIIEKSDQVYMQALRSEQDWWLEFREGDADHHFRAETRDRDVVLLACIG